MGINCKFPHITVKKLPYKGVRVSLPGEFAGIKCFLGLYDEVGAVLCG